MLLAQHTVRPTSPAKLVSLNLKCSARGTDWRKMALEHDLDLAIVGNCHWGGLVDRQGRLVWGCFPRFDGDPLFCSLLGGEQEMDRGCFEIELLDFAESEQHYEGNSAVLVTTLRDRLGNALRIKDFAPRFRKHGRIYRPTMLVRVLEPLQGNPRIRIRLTPAANYAAGIAEVTSGTNHIRYITPNLTLRLTTDAPVGYVREQTPFVLEESCRLILGPDETLSDSVEQVAGDFHERTLDYWMEWSRSLSIPFEWQEAVIRAAITLKLCSFEETGAIVAALTTSIPEAPGTQRNWDYRYCWPRDAYFVVHALNRLGATRTMEGYLSYLTNIAAGSDGRLQPVYGIGLESQLHERTEPGLPGYRGIGPVRVGNQAWEHTQNDVYGSVVLAATQAFFDRRLRNPGGEELFQRLEQVAEQARKCWDQPDAGLWELRNSSHVHTFSAVMCWAACDRLGKIAAQIGRQDRASAWRREADAMRAGILERAWNEEQQSFADRFEGSGVDASLLLLHELGFLPATDPRFVSTVEAIGRELRRGEYLFRYREDDFGSPKTAFNICTFWYIEALDAIGRREEARALFENMLEQRTSLGLLSEDLDPETQELWGNFPQTYSMVGLINCAMRLSKRWDEAF